ncbi:hypothetical protein SprV_0501882700 [Sparganum proliferum]
MLTPEINETLMALENSGTISLVDRRMARAQDTALTRFYGLPKVHKSGAPSRRIEDLAVETIELLLRDNYDETENDLGHAQILQLLQFCLKTYFTFDVTIYKQVKGEPTRSPISGLVAKSVLKRLESLVFRRYRPKFWGRYVDDTFVVIERDQVPPFKEHPNAILLDVQFTIREEQNNQLVFLYVLVCRKDCGGLKTKLFRKATNTTQVLSYNINHPISHKRSCVGALYQRVETRFSELEDYDTFYGCVEGMDTHATSSVSACANEMGNETQAARNFGDTSPA